MSVFFDYTSSSEYLTNFANEAPGGWDELTVSVWAKWLGNNVGYIFSKFADGNLIAATTFNAPANGTIYCFAQDANSSVAYSYSNTGAFNDNDWHHLLYTWDSTVGRVNIWIDGSQCDTGNVDNGGYALRTVDDVINVGRRPDDTYYWDGYVEHLGIWNRKLSANEKSLLFPTCRFRPNHPQLVQGLQTYWPLDQPKSGSIHWSHVGLNDFCVSQAFGDLHGGVSAPDWSEDSPGLNMNPGIPLRPANYGIDMRIAMHHYKMLKD